MGSNNQAAPGVISFMVTVDVPVDWNATKLANDVENKLSDALKWMQPDIAFRVSQMEPIWAPPKDLA